MRTKKKGNIQIAQKCNREHIPNIFGNHCTSIISIKMSQFDLFQAAISVGMLQNMQATRVSSMSKENEGKGRPVNITIYNNNLYSFFTKASYLGKESVRNEVSCPLKELPKNI